MRMPSRTSGTLTLAIALLGMPAATASSEPVGLDSGWVRDPSVPVARDFGATWSVEGALAGRNGNFHTVVAEQSAAAQKLRVQITDYRCGGSGCERVAESLASATVTRGRDYTAVGAVGLDIDTSVSGGSAAPLPVRLSLRPAGSVSYSVGAIARMRERWETFSVVATGQLGPLSLAAPGVVLVSGRLSSETTYTWSGTGASPARQSPARAWAREFDGRDAMMSWVLPGVVPGRPGNAHSGWASGWVSWTSSQTNGHAAAEWNDWICPDRVTPPAFAVVGASCTLVRTDRAPATKLGPGFVGDSGLRLTGRMPTTIIKVSGVTSSTAGVDLSLVPSGPQSDTTGIYPKAKVRNFTALDSLATGRLGWVDLSTSTLSPAGGRVTNHQTWQRVPGFAGSHRREQR